MTPLQQHTLGSHLQATTLTLSASSWHMFACIGWAHECMHQQASSTDSRSRSAGLTVCESACIGIRFLVWSIAQRRAHRFAAMITGSLAKACGYVACVGSRAPAASAAPASIHAGSTQGLFRPSAPTASDGRKHGAIASSFHRCCCCGRHHDSGHLWPWFPPRPSHQDGSSAIPLGTRFT